MRSLWISRVAIVEVRVPKKAAVAAVLAALALFAVSGAVVACFGGDTPPPSGNCNVGARCECVINGEPRQGLIIEVTQGNPPSTEDDLCTGFSTHCSGWPTYACNLTEH